MKFWIIFTFVGILILIAAILLILLYVGFIEDKIVPHDIALDDYLQKLRIYGIIVSIISVVLGSIWILIGKSAIIDINSLKTNKLKYFWLMFGAFSSIISVLLVLFLLNRVQDGEGWIYAFFIVLPLLVYYLFTILASPSSLKYIPVGSKMFRKKLPW